MTSFDDVSLDYALAMDRDDELASFRSEFIFPKIEGHDQAIYLCGNSLGLQPKNLRKEVEIHLEKWADEAVEGHFTGIL
ncbi:hypothetical protein EON65_34115 [archaeon]|nr:MAG: hypothetical protein EON65_34115 [archaeon]